MPGSDTQGYGEVGSYTTEWDHGRKRGEPTPLEGEQAVKEGHDKEQAGCFSTLFKRL